MKSKLKMVVENGMKFNTVIGLLFMMMICSCTQHSAQSGLKIDNGINRGISYTDSIGADYNLRYIPITIINDSSIPIRLHINFLKEYNYPQSDKKEKFRLILLPEEWALEGIGVTESMMTELPNYIDKPLLNNTLEPGEKFLVVIGTLYPRPPKNSGILPNTLFTHNRRDMFTECDWLMQEDPLSSPKNTLGLKLNFGNRCMVIPCGQISYPDS